ncbi:diaminopropionate ammonia-lyase [Agrococcus carbonis]|uniref:Diaminopropionate ammonia-lyase n=1 Tax=Agrococcus carbonis TaxID=684552 RepID=A0A1H1KSH4_9MICO|nr:diaminopropionate ammonia-lyase [Agrococcus carbonis]SDR65244.1 diaminopropionate ammonia-lyase [Agrococcus carbonis]
MSRTAGVYRNPTARDWRCEPVTGIAEFHASLPSYAPTPLVELPELARELGVGRVFVKDESARMGLPAFKALGVSYAIVRALTERLSPGAEPLPVHELRERLHGSGVTLIAATDGNHGRAVAHLAAMLGVAAEIFVPSTVTETARHAIEGEGATVRVLGAPYDEVVAAAADAAADDPDALHIQDTAWPGYHEVPQWIVDGYETLCAEADEQLAEAGAERLDLVAVPVGVGSLAQAVVRHWRSASVPDGRRQPTMLSVEPELAPTLIASLEAGEPVGVETGGTMMLGLDCGTLSELAWPILRDGVDAAVTVTEDDAARAVHDLQRLGVDAGPCGAASLAGLRALRAAEHETGDAAELLPADAVVLLLSTEGSAANPLPERYR